ncbi:MAG: RNA polymerase sigma factor [Myxococcales bacterium]
MQAALRRDEDREETPAIAEIYRDHLRAVARWARSLGGPQADVDDLVQEVFTVALRRLPSYRGEAKLTTWLFGITRNVIRAERQRSRWRRLWGRLTDEVADSVATLDRTPAEALEQRQLRQRVYRALEKLGERQRTAFILFEVDELPGEEIAERMGIKVATLWVTLHRARAEVARQLRRMDEEERA